MPNFMLIIICIGLLSLTGCNQHKQRVEKIRSELKKEDVSPGKAEEVANTLNGYVKVENNYPVFSFKVTLKQYIPESVAKNGLETFNAKVKEDLCGKLEEYKSKYGTDNSKALAEVLSQDNVKFDFKLEDQIGTSLIQTSQVLSECPNFATLTQS